VSLILSFMNVSTPLCFVNRPHLELALAQAVQTQGPTVDLNHWDVSGIQDFSHLFNPHRYSYLKDFQGRIDAWDLSRATDTSFMFFESSFNGDISKWNVSQVTKGFGMFYRSSFTQDISSWTFDQLQMGGFMFRDCPLPMKHFPDFPNIQNMVDSAWLFMGSVLDPTTGQATGSMSPEHIQSCLYQIQLQRHLRDEGLEPTPKHRL